MFVVSNENNMKRITTILGIMIIASFVPSVMLITSKSQVSFAASFDVRNFMNMTEEQRIQAAKNMTQKNKEMVMNEFLKQNSTVNENMSETTTPKDTKPLMGNFVDAGDGFHKAQVLQKYLILQVAKLS